MSEDKHSRIIGAPMFDDDDPSGGWGLVALIAILSVVIAIAAWITLGALR